MKNKLLLSLGCGAMLFAGCTQNIDEPMFEVPTHDKSIAINISGTIDQTYTTRVDDGGFCDGDQIGLFGVNYTDNNTVAGILLDEGNQVDNARYTFDEINWQWVSSGDIYYKDAETNIDLYGYYPYANVESVNAYEFEVAQDQSGANAVDGYAMSDFLWGKAENIAPSEAKVKIKFNHKMACANVILAEGDGFVEEEFATLKKSVLAMNTIRTAEIDLSTGEVTAVGEAESEGIVMKSNVEGFRAIVVPQSVYAGKALFAITVDGVSYRFKKDVDFTYEQGKQSKFTITINKKVPSGEYEFVLTDTEIIDWVADLDTHGGEARQYYVVHQEEPGTLSAKLRAAKKDPTKIKNLKISGEIDGRDFCFMRDSMSLLQSVNLKESEIKASWYQEAYVGGTSSANLRAVCGPGLMPESSSDRQAIIKANCSKISMFGSNYGQNEDDEIPYWAFRNNLYLTNFVFPEKVTKIGESAFAGCSLLSGALIIPNDVTEISDAAFSGCSNIASLSLPSRLEKIGGFAFSKCYSLSGSLNIPESVTYIGGDAFSNCSGFTGSLILPDNLKDLGSNSFCNCVGFTGSLSIPQSLKTIYGATFYGCSGLNGQLILHNDLSLSNDKYEGPNGGTNVGIFENCRFQGELKIPNNITTIPKACFSGCQFSSIAGFPEGLLSIEDKAFSYNGRLSGVIEFPESLVSVGIQAFESCRNIEGVILPNDLAVIKTNAFSGCYYINKLVCKSSEPPMVQNGAFSGVSKTNFVLEVPESAVNRYQTTSGWSDFKRIGAHYDFSISCRKMRVLNATHSQEVVLRAPANYAWSIDSKPDWVTVSPSSGIGKTEVVVTVDEMSDADVSTFEINTGAYNSPKYETHNGRSDEIVFLLNDKDYRITMSVEQYDCDNYDGEVIVNQTASKGNGVNIVFMGDCFDARDIAMGNYLDGVNEAIGYYFDIEPYKTYKEYFNVYTIIGLSNDSGMGTMDTIKEARFGSQYINEGISPNTNMIFDYAYKAPTVCDDNIAQSLIVLIENTSEYGGQCLLWDDGSSVAICPMSDDAYPYDYRGIVQHEAGGHGFGKLGDESIEHNAFATSCGFCGYASIPVRQAHSRGWYQNLSLTENIEKVGWSHLIFNPKYSNIVDVYEGGFFHSRGIFRSEPNSCMNNNIPYYSAISRQAIVERIMQYADKRFDINEFYANDVLDSQGNITGGTRSIEENAITLTGAGKQMPPKFMGDKPQLKRSNK